MTLWLLGGHDPTRGAGLHRDLVTARVRAPALPRCFAVTARTEQGHGRAARAWPVPEARLRARVEKWPRPRAIKVGLVPDELAAVVAELVASTGAPVVLDPVLRASDGGALGSTPRGLAPLLAVATLITPNRAEARALVGAGAGAGEDAGADADAGQGADAGEDADAGQGAGEDVDDDALVRALARGGAAVLRKGGHDPDPYRVIDRLITRDRVTEFARPRQPGPDPRGTGCALATAIAAGLALGVTLEQAVGEAIAWLDEERTRWHVGPDGRAHLPDHGR